MKKTHAGSLLCLLTLCVLCLFAGARGEQEISLALTPTSPLRFTNVLFHYVRFDAEVRHAEKLSVRVYNPEGKQIRFRTRRHVDQNLSPIRSAGYLLKAGQEKCEDMNVLLLSGIRTGVWTIEVTASAEGKESVVRKLSVQVDPPRELHMNRLAEVHEMILGAEGGETVPVEKGKIRYIAQNPKDPWFVKEYWFSGAFDLRPGANQKCTRAVLSMALSYLGIDCSPIRMSELVRSEEIEYRYDAVCEKLGNIRRVTGTLEELWQAYQEGKASPVLLHFRFGEGMHAVLLVARDEEDPELFYAVTTGQRVDTSAFSDGQRRDCVIPILIENGEEGQRIQSPLLKRYHKAVIDQIWQWTEETVAEASPALEWLPFLR